MKHICEQLFSNSPFVIPDQFISYTDLIECPEISYAIL